MITGKKVLFLTTTDNMIWQFLLAHIKHLQNAGNIVECACTRTGFWFDDLVKTHGLVVHDVEFKRNPFSLNVKKFRQNARAFKELKRIVKEGGYDLIHCHQPVGGVMGRRVGAVCGVPVIYTAHGFHFFKGSSLKSNIYKFIETHYAKKTNALVTMNNEDYQAALGMKAKHKYLINGIGYDPTKNKDYPFDVNLLRQEIGVSDDDFVVVNIGECIKRKNHKVLFQAFKEINEPNIKLVICGGGKLFDQYKKTIKELGLEGKVKLLGYRKDARNILKLADVFVFPSLQEGLPMSIMESMFQGIPVIASDIRGNRDLVKDGENGILTSDFKTAIMKLYSDKDLTKQMGENGRELVKKFYIENVLNQMEEIYNEVLKSNK